MDFKVFTFIFVVATMFVSGCAPNRNSTAAERGSSPAGPHDASQGAFPDLQGSLMGRSFYLGLPLGPVLVTVIADYENEEGRRRVDARTIRSNKSKNVGQVYKGLVPVDLMNADSGVCSEKFCVGQTYPWTYRYNRKLARSVKVLALARYSNANCDLVGEGPKLFNDGINGPELICHKFEDFQ